MPQSLSKMLVHLIFSTEDRRPFIRDGIRGELNAYCIGIFKVCQSPALIINSRPEHAHILFSLSKNWSLADVVEEVQKRSSKWIKSKGYDYRDFYWQGGYGAYTLSEADKEEVIRYIANQEEHHRVVSFQDELRTLFDLNCIEYDERYLWSK